MSKNALPVGERVALLNAFALRAMGHGFRCFTDHELLAIDFGDRSSEALAVENMHGTPSICRLVAARNREEGSC